MNKKLKANCFNLVNYNGKAVLFRAADPALNKLTFSIINSTGEPLNLIGGEPAGSATSAGGASSFNFHFESMLSAEAVQDLKAGLPDKWRAVLFTQGGVSSWSVAPAEDMVLETGASVKIMIDNIRCESIQPGNFNIFYFNVPGYQDSEFPVAIHLNVLNPSEPQKKTLPLETGCINVIHPVQGQAAQPGDKDPKNVIPVFITYDQGALIENGFTYFLMNTSADPLVSAFKTPYGQLPENDRPSLFISFLFGHEVHDITTREIADNNISIGMKVQSEWEEVKHLPATPYWKFLPQNSKVLEGHECISFPVSKIITSLNAEPDTISLMYIQLNNIPGYNDAIFTVPLHKRKAKAAVLTLEASSYSITLNQNVEVSWSTELARRVTLEYLNRNGEKILLDSLNGDIKADGSAFKLPQAPDADPTLIIATAYDDEGHHSKEIVLKVKQLPAAIENFTATPSLISAHSATELMLEWETSQAKSLTLTTPDGEIAVTGKTSFCYPALKSAFTFKLLAESYYAQAPAHAVVPVTSYGEEQPVRFPMNPDGLQGFPALSIHPLTKRLYASDRGSNTVYEIDPETASITRRYPGSAFVVNEAGTKILIYDDKAARPGVGLYDVRSGAHAENVSSLDGQVGETDSSKLLLLPNTEQVFWTVALKSGRDVPRLTVIQMLKALPETNTLQASGFADRENFSAIADMKLSEDARKLFVAREDSIVIIGLPGNEVIANMGYRGGSPVKLLLPKGTDVLYLAAAQGVIVFDVTSQQVIQIIDTDRAPVNMVLSPDEKYLFAALVGTSEIVVIETMRHTVTRKLAVGKFPYGMAFNADGSLLFVANYCSKTLSVIDLKSSAARQEEIATGDHNGNPLDVAVYDTAPGICKVFVMKENTNQRMFCGGLSNTSVNMNVFSIQRDLSIKAKQLKIQNGI